MISKHKFLIVSIVLLGLVLFIPPNVSAQENSASLTNETISSEANQELTKSASLDNELEPLEGVEVTEVKSMPSGFGFWWRNIKEWTSLTLTFDSVKKSEKQLKFAEERTRLANFIIQNSDDPKVQEKAEKMLEKANQHMQKIEERKDDLVKKTDEKSQKLLRNIAKHYLNKERILEKIEDKLSPEKIEEFQQLRKTFEEKRQNFLNDLRNNPNITQEIKDRVTDVLSQVDNTHKMREEFRMQQKDILEKVKAGSEEVREQAKERFEELREARKKSQEQLKEQFKTQKEEIINKIQDGDQEAVKKLKELNLERQKEALKIREEMKQKAMEIKDGKQLKRQE